jgi:hypothetical protein
MKKILLLSIILSAYSISSMSQTKPVKECYLKLSGGRVAFGTGDFLGYSASVDFAVNLIKKPSFALAKFLIGAELIFESGTKNPVIENPTPTEFLAKSFNHTSSTVLWVKGSYYPFKKILSGFNIQIGPTIGYTQRSREARATLITDPLGSERRSTLLFINSFTYGYRISTGFEFNLSKKVLTGARIDLGDNNDGDVNTLVGIKLGVRL